MSEKLLSAIGGIDDKFISEQAVRFEGAQPQKNNRTFQFARPAFRRAACAACVAVLICGATLGVAFADNIKEFIKTVLSSENGTVEISDIATVSIKDTAIKDVDSLPLTISETEEMLGIDILIPDKAAADILYYRPLMSGKNIGRVDLYFADFIDYSVENEGIEEAAQNAANDDEYQGVASTRKWIVMDIAFITQYADEGYTSAFASGIDAGGQKSIENTYTLDNIGVDAIIYTYDWSETRLNATFVYNNMLYVFYADNVSLDEMLDMLGSLK